MSRLAQVFVVINLFLSLLFFGTSATLFLTRQDLKGEKDAQAKLHSEALAELETGVEKLESTYARQAQALTVLRAKEGKLSQDLREKADALQSATQRANSAEAARDKATDLVKATSNELAARDARIQELERILQDATSKRDEALTLASEANDERNRALRDLEEEAKQHQELKQTYVALLDDHQALELRGEALESALGDIPFPSIPAPPLDAEVVAVDPDLGAVVLNVGQDQEVKVGVEFTIHRRGRFVGKVKVKKLYRDMSGADVVFENDGVNIQPGDQATTRVNL